MCDFLLPTHRSKEKSVVGAPLAACAPAVAFLSAFGFAGSTSGLAAALLFFLLKVLAFSGQKYSISGRF
jgi:hypothetical protein